MFKVMRALGQMAVLLAGITSLVYAVHPELRRWVETELVARDAWYLVGVVEVGPDGERFEFAQFYSNRWEPSTLLFDERLRRNQDDAFDVFAALPGETLIATPTEAFGPMPGRSQPRPLAHIETLALADQCFKVEEVSCQPLSLADRDVVENDIDPGCEATERDVRRTPEEIHRLRVWVRATRFTCAT